MRLDKISPEPSRGKGWAIIKFIKDDPSVVVESMAIVRPRYSDSYLGREGWQISEARIPLNIQNTTGHELTLLLSPSIVQHLEVNQNLEFIFFDAQVQRTGSSTFRWHGMSYRAPGGEKSPIEVIQVDGPPNPGSIWGITDNGHEPSVDPTATPSAEGLPQGGIELPLDVTFGDLAPPEVEVHPPFVHEPPPPPPPPAVYRLRCKNSRCAHEILSTHHICPFCGTKQY